MNVIAGFLLLLPIAAFAASCAGGGGKEAPPTSTATSTVAPPTPSPFPTARPTLDAAARFGAVHAAPVPAFDGGTTWFPTQLIPDSHLVLVYSPPGYLECETQGCQYPPGDPKNPGRLALWNIDTGAVDVFRALEPGQQLPATGSDGHFLAWAEGCRNPEGDGWDVYAMDLATREWWHVDTDFATVSGDSWLDACPTALIVDHGRLVYSTAIANLSGHYVFELRAYDLATRTRSVLKLSGDVPPVHIGCAACGVSEDGLVAGHYWPAYANNGQLVWVGPGQEACSSNYTCTTPNAVYVTNLSDGDTREITDNDDILRLLTGSDQGRSAGESRWADPLQVTSGFVLWVDRPENVAMAYDLKSRDLIKLSDCSVDLLAADDNAIYWTCADQLRWVDLPQP
jgi:hypothetical protein